VPLHTASLLEIAGPVQNVDGVVHLRVRELRPLSLAVAAPPAKHWDAFEPDALLPDSHDYR
jgi:hypothetical protein